MSNNALKLLAQKAKKRLKNTPNLLVKPGIIINLFLNILSIAYLATYLLLTLLVLKLPPATLLKLVSTEILEYTVIY